MFDVHLFLFKKSFKTHLHIASKLASNRHVLPVKILTHNKNGYDPKSGNGIFTFPSIIQKEITINMVMSPGRQVLTI